MPKVWKRNNWVWLKSMALHSLFIPIYWQKRKAFRSSAARESFMGQKWMGGNKENLWLRTVVRPNGIRELPERSLGRLIKLGRWKTIASNSRYVGQRIANCRDEVRLNKKPESQTKSTQPTNPQQNQDSWFHPQVNPRHVPKPKQVSPPASLW